MDKMGLFFALMFLAIWILWAFTDFKTGQLGMNVLIDGIGMGLSFAWIMESLRK